MWELEQADVASWGTLFLEARRELIRLRHELIGAPSPEFAEGSIATVPREQKPISEMEA